MQINEISKLTGVSATTIRFYEKAGVLPKAQRGHNGYRSYPEERIVQIKMIARAKEFDFTLKEIKELSVLLFSKKLSRKEMAKQLQKKNAEIDLRIENLHKIKMEINEALQGLCEFKNNLEDS